MRGAWSCALIVCVLLIASRSSAEPYLAIRTGKKCIVCHTNPTGGGMRTEYGNIYSQLWLAAKYRRIGKAEVREVKPVSDDDDDDPFGDGPEDEQGPLGTRPAAGGPMTFWSGSFGDHLSVGGDLRTSFDVTMIPHQDDDVGFFVDRALLYAEIAVIPGRVSFQLDEQVAPGGAFSRQAYVLVQSESQRSYLKAGRMFLPYGLRIQDDSAFIRQVPGINYNTPDTGVEVGWEPGPWSFNLAVTNGSGGGTDADRGKQYSLRLSHIRRGWRLGASWNFNDAGADERRMANVFGGFQTGRVTWMAELDYIVDEALGGREMVAGLAEVNILVKKGHNLKITYEYFDPDLDVDEDERDRVSIQWEAFPMQFTQLRLGYRLNAGIPQNDLQNTEELFLELHLFF